MRKSWQNYSLLLIRIMMGKSVLSNYKVFNSQVIVLYSTYIFIFNHSLEGLQNALKSAALGSSSQTYSVTEEQTKKVLAAFDISGDGALQLSICNKFWVISLDITTIFWRWISAVGLGSISDAVGWAASWGGICCCKSCWRCDESWKGHIRPLLNVLYVYVQDAC